MGGANSHHIIDHVDGLLSRIGASIRARGARLIRMDVHLGRIALGSRVQKSWLAKVYVSGFLGGVGTSGMGRGRSTAVG